MSMTIFLLAWCLCHTSSLNIVNLMLLVAARDHDLPEFHYVTEQRGLHAQITGYTICSA